MVSYKVLYEFIKQHYKPERFEDRNGVWAKDYSYRIVMSYIDELRKHGYAFITKHESVTGRAIYFDHDLHIIEKTDGKNWYRVDVSVVNLETKTKEWQPVGYAHGVSAAARLRQKYKPFLTRRVIITTPIENQPTPAYPDVANGLGAT